MNEFIKDLSKKDAQQLDRVLKWFKGPHNEKAYTTLDTLTDYIFNGEGMTKELAEYYLNLLCEYQPTVMNKKPGFGNDKYRYYRTEQWFKLEDNGGFSKILNNRRLKEVRKNIYKGVWDIIKILVGFGAGLIYAYCIKK